MRINKQTGGTPEYLLLSVVTALAFLVRFYVFEFTYAINKDGILYINQAKALLTGNWELALNCGYEFISLYHILIPVLYRALGDWILAAKSISLFFGTIAIIPFYLIARQFCSRSPAVLASLAFSLNPFFVSNSVALIKDPIFWFFSLLGIFFCIAAFNSRDKDYFLIFAGISFLIGSLARFEILVYYAGSVLFLLTERDKRLKKIMFLTGPLFLSSIIMFSGLYIYDKDLNVWAIYFQPRIQLFFYGLSDSMFGTDFLRKTVHGLGLIVSSLSKVSYWPFLPFLAAGLYRYRNGLSNNKNLSYFVLLSCLSIIALYFFYLKIEVLSSRYAALIILPLLVFIGTGIKHAVDLLTKRGFKEKNIVLTISLYLLTAGLIPNIDSERADKLVYRTIGEYISEHENYRSTKVVAADPRVMFYANLNSSEIICSDVISYDQLRALTYTELVAKLKNEGIAYFLWEEDAWQTAAYNFLDVTKKENFTEITRLDHDNKRLILFKVL